MNQAFLKGGGISIGDEAWNLPMLTQVADTIALERESSLALPLSRDREEDCDVEANND